MKRPVMFTAAVCLLLFFIAGCNDKPPIEVVYESAIPTEQAAPTKGNTAQTQQTSVPENVIYAEEADIIDGWVPGIGEYNLSGGVSQALRDETKSDVYLFVRIRIHDPKDQDFYKDFTFEGKTREQWRASLESISREYAEGHTEFFNARIEEVMKDAETTEEKEKAISALQAEFDEMWMQNHDILPLTEWLRFEDAYMTTEAERGNKAVLDEQARLISHGLDIRTRTRVHQTDHGYVYEHIYIVGFVTIEQIRNFPFGEYGYVISLAHKDDAIDA